MVANRAKNTGWDFLWLKAAVPQPLTAIKVQLDRLVENEPTQLIANTVWALTMLKAAAIIGLAG